MHALLWAAAGCSLPGILAACKLDRIPCNGGGSTSTLPGVLLHAAAWLSGLP